MAKTQQTPYETADPIDLPYNSTRESALFPTALPTGYRSGNTFEQILQASWSPDAPDKLDKKELYRLYAELADSVGKYKTAQNKELAKERIARVKARIDVQANQKKFLAALHQYAAGDRQQAMRSITDAKVALYHDMTTLSKSNPQFIEQFYSIARRAAMDAGNNNEVGLQTVFGSLESEGVLMEGSTELPDIMDRLRNGFADGDWNTIKDEKLRAVAIQLQERADSIREDHTRMRGWLEESYNGLNGIADQLGKGSTMEGQPLNLPKLISDAETYGSKIDQAVGTISGLNVATAKSQLDQMMADDEYFNLVQGDLQKVSDKLFSADDDAAGYRTRMAQIIGTPKFQAWAKDQGLTIGTVKFDENGNVVEYLPGKHDALALIVATREVRNPNALIHGKNTGEWVEVRRKVPGSDGPVDAPLINGQAAYIMDENGNRVFLDEAQVDATAQAQKLRRFDVGSTTLPADPEAGRPKPQHYYVVRDNLTGKVYADDEQGTSWIEVGDPAFVTSSVKNWQTAAIQSGDGSWRLMTGNDLKGKPADVFSLRTDEEMKLLGANARKLGDVVALTDQPMGNVKYETVYGKRIPMRATDELGSIRVRTPGHGELYIPAAENAGHTVTAQKSGTTLRDVLTEAAARQDEKRAQAGGDGGSPTPVTNVWDRLIATTNREGQKLERTQAANVDAARRADLSTQRPVIDVPPVMAGEVAAEPPGRLPRSVTPVEAAQRLGHPLPTQPIMDTQGQAMMVDGLTRSQNAQLTQATLPRAPVTAEQVREARGDRPAGSTDRSFIPGQSSNPAQALRNLLGPTGSPAPAPAPTPTPASSAPTPAKPTPTAAATIDTARFEDLVKRRTAAKEAEAKKTSDKATVATAGLLAAKPQVQVDEAALTALRNKMAAQMAARKQAEFNAAQAASAGLNAAPVRGTVAR